MTDLRRRTVPIASALAVGIALAGCGVTPGSETSSPSDVTLIDGRYDDGAPGDASKQPVRAAGYEVPQGTYGLEGRDAVLVRAPEMEAYLRNLLSRVARPIESADYSGEVGVFLTSQQTLIAVTTPADEVLVSSGAIDKVNNEEELAFLLAHELSHVVRRDIVERSEVMGGQDQASRRVRQLVQVATKLVEEAQASPAVDADTAREVSELRREIQIAVHGLQLALENNVGPAWTLEQERTADRLAADLLYKAGYNPLNAAAIFGTLGDAKAKQKEAVERHIEEIQELAKELAALREDDPLVTNLKGAAIELGGKALEGVVDLFQTDEYEAATERKDAFKAYVQERYGVERAGLGKTQALKRLKEGDTTFAAIQQRIEKARQAEKSFNEAYSKPEDARGRDNGLAESVETAKEAISGVGSDAGLPRLVLHRIRKDTGKDRLARLNLEPVLDRPELGPAPALVSARYFAEQGNEDRAFSLIDRLERYGQPSIYPVAYEVHKSLGREQEAKKILNACLDDVTARRYRLKCREFERERERSKEDPDFFDRLDNTMDDEGNSEQADSTGTDEGDSSDDGLGSLFK